MSCLAKKYTEVLSSEDINKVFSLLSPCNPSRIIIHDFIEKYAIVDFYTEYNDSTTKCSILINENGELEYLDDFHYGYRGTEFFTDKYKEDNCTPLSLERVMDTNGEPTIYIHYSMHFDANVRGKKERLWSEGVYNTARRHGSMMWFESPYNFKWIHNFKATILENEQILVELKDEHGEVKFGLADDKEVNWVLFPQFEKIELKGGVIYSFSKDDVRNNAGVPYSKEYSTYSIEKKEHQCIVSGFVAHDVDFLIRQGQYYAGMKIKDVGDENIYKSHIFFEDGAIEDKQQWLRLVRDTELLTYCNSNHIVQKDQILDFKLPDFFDTSGKKLTVNILINGITFEQAFLRYNRYLRGLIGGRTITVETSVYDEMLTQQYASDQINDGFAIEDTTYSDSIKNLRDNVYYVLTEEQRNNISRETGNKYISGHFEGEYSCLMNDIGGGFARYIIDRKGHIIIYPKNNYNEIEIIGNKYFLCKNIEYHCERKPEYKDVVIPLPCGIDEYDWVFDQWHETIEIAIYNTDGICLLKKINRSEEPIIHKISFDLWKDSSFRELVYNNFGTYLRPIAPNKGVWGYIHQSGNQKIFNWIIGEDNDIKQFDINNPKPLFFKITDSGYGVLLEGNSVQIDKSSSISTLCVNSDNVVIDVDFSGYKTLNYGHFILQSQKKDLRKNCENGICRLNMHYTNCVEVFSAKGEKLSNNGLGLYYCGAVENFNFYQRIEEKWGKSKILVIDDNDEVIYEGNPLIWLKSDGSFLLVELSMDAKDNPDDPDYYCASAWYKRDVIYKISIFDPIKKQKKSCEYKIEEGHDLGKWEFCSDDEHFIVFNVHYNNTGQIECWRCITTVDANANIHLQHHHMNSGKMLELRNGYIRTETDIISTDGRFESLCGNHNKDVCAIYLKHPDKTKKAVGIFDIKKMQIISDCGYSSVNIIEKEDYSCAIVSRYHNDTETHLFGVISIPGEKSILPIEFAEIMKVEKKCSYDKEPFDYHIFSNGDKVGLLFKDIVILECEYDSIEYYYIDEYRYHPTNMLLIRKGDKYGLVKSGKIVLDCCYDEIAPIRYMGYDDEIKAAIGDKYCLVDLSNDIVTPPSYSDIVYDEKTYKIFIKNRDLLGIYLKHDKIIIPSIFSSIQEANRDFIISENKIYNVRENCKCIFDNKNDLILLSWQDSYFMFQEKETDKMHLYHLRDGCVSSCAYKIVNRNSIKVDGEWVDLYESYYCKINEDLLFLPDDKHFWTPQELLDRKRKDEGYYDQDDYYEPDIDWEEETYYALGGSDYNEWRENGGNLDDMMDGMGF